MHLKAQFDTINFNDHVRIPTLHLRVRTAIYMVRGEEICYSSWSPLRSRFVTSEAPLRGVIIRWHENLFEHRNVLHRMPVSGGTRSVCTEENKEAVASGFTRSPKKSIRLLLQRL